jgi:DNA modification methylase
MKPYYEQDGIVIYHGDCREVMPTLGEVDSVITSPPYNLNTRVNRQRKYISRQVTDEFSTKYRGAYSDNMHPDEYLEFTSLVLTQCLRLAPFVFWNVQLATGNKPALCALLGRFAGQVKEIAIWDKGHAQPAMKDRTFNSAFEFMLILSRQDPETRQFPSADFPRGTFDNLWRVSPERGPVGHGATFPLALVEKCLRVHPARCVLDPFMGSGTTLVAAKLEGRKAIGIELEEKYCEIAAKRLAQGVLNFD